MTFDPNQPFDDIYMVDLPNSVRNNFQAIQQGSDSFAMTSCNLSSLDPSAANPTPSSSVGKIFMKEDVYGNQNIFVALPPHGSDPYSLTLFPPTVVRVRGNKNSELTLQCSFLPGGMMMACGLGNIINQQIFSFSFFEEVYSIVGNGIRPTNTTGEGAFGVVFVPIQQGSYSSKNSFQITINRDDSAVRGVTLLLFGIPSAAFLSSTPTSQGEK